MDEMDEMGAESAAIDDGGPAFPVPGLQHDEQFNGMSLRDYFAAHSDEPGPDELADVAGLCCRAGSVWTKGRASCKSLEGWLDDLPRAERLRLVARAKYDRADAMLAARGAT